MLLSTPKRLAITGSESPRERISTTISISTVDRALSWRKLSSDFGLRRPRALVSLALSFCVPSSRCVGLTHGGLSHLWRTTTPAGTGPFASAHETRYAFRGEPFGKLASRPYPYLSLVPFHGQHSFCPMRSTFAQKRSTTDARGARDLHGCEQKRFAIHWRSDALFGLTSGALQVSHTRITRLLPWSPPACGRRAPRRSRRPWYGACRRCPSRWH